ncbi:MAG TPA: hypothetical protein PLH33_05245, partial [Chitinophagaceae bacterium]|nr:hypothetical protein [Chitinophagaceae bacterium]
MNFIKKANNLFILSFIVLFVFTSCTKKRYPANTPFVYNNKIILNGNISKDEKKRLKVELQ